MSQRATTFCLGWCEPQRRIVWPSGRHGDIQVTLLDDVNARSSLNDAEDFGELDAWLRRH
jgi:hypothetical protein